MRQNTLPRVFGVAFLIAVVLIAAGFFYPDPYLAGGQAHGAHVWIITALKILASLSMIGVALLVAAIFRGRAPGSVLALIPLGLLLAGLLAYPVMTEFVAGHSGRRDRKEFHTYLQLKPQLITVKENSVRKIVALGGSTTRWPDSKGVQWTALLEQRLAESCATSPYRVFNQGQDWYTTLHSIINYSTNIRQYRPEVVLIMHGINDMMHNAEFSYLSSGPFQNDYGHYLGPIAQLVNQKTPLQLVSSYLRRYWYYNGERSHIAQTDFKGVAAFKQNLNTLIDLVTLDGGKPMLMTEAFSYREGMNEQEMARLDMLHYEGQGPSGYWTVEEGIAGMRAYAEAVREVAKSRNVPLVDLEAAIPKDMKYFLDDVHFTDRGFDLVVKAVAGRMQQELGCSAGVKVYQSQSANEQEARPAATGAEMYLASPGRIELSQRPAAGGAGEYN